MFGQIQTLTVFSGTHFIQRVEWFHLFRLFIWFIHLYKFLMHKLSYISHSYLVLKYVLWFFDTCCYEIREKPINKKMTLCHPNFWQQISWAQVSCLSCQHYFLWIMNLLLLWNDLSKLVIFLSARSSLASLARASSTSADVTEVAVVVGIP